MPSAIRLAGVIYSSASPTSTASWRGRAERCPWLLSAQRALLVAVSYENNRRLRNGSVLVVRIYFRTAVLLTYAVGSSRGEQAFLLLSKMFSEHPLGVRCADLHKTQSQKHEAKSASFHYVLIWCMSKPFVFLFFIFYHVFFFFEHHSRIRERPVSPHCNLRGTWFHHTAIQSERTKMYCGPLPGLRCVSWCEVFGFSEIVSHAPAQLARRLFALSASEPHRQVAGSPPCTVWAWKNHRGDIEQCRTPLGVPNWEVADTLRSVLHCSMSPQRIFIEAHIGQGGGAGHLCGRPRGPMVALECNY